MDVGNRSLSFILLISFAFIAAACGDDSKTPPEIPVDDTDLLGTVTDADVMNSPCLASQDYFNQKVKPALVMPPEDVLAKNFETFSESLQGSLTLQDINSKCAKDDSLCKINKLLGEDTGIRAIYILNRYGFNISPYQKIVKDYGYTTRDYTMRELDSVVQALESMPPGFRAKENARPMIRVTYLGRNVLANAVVTLADLWGSSSRPSQVATIVHELGHVTEFDVTFGDDWRAISGWPAAYSNRSDEVVRTYFDYEIGRPKTLPSEYAHKNPREDFAESVMFYRFAPEKMKKASPEKYQWIRYHVFQGIEYTSASTCQQPSACQTLTKSPMSVSEYMEASDRCGALAIYDAVNSKGAKDLVDDCIRTMHVKNEAMTYKAQWNLLDATADAMAQVCSLHREPSKVEFKSVAGEQLQALTTAMSMQWKSKLEKACLDDIKENEILKDCDLAVRNAYKKVEVPGGPKAEKEQKETVLKLRDSITDYCKEVCSQNHPDWNQSKKKT